MARGRSTYTPVLGEAEGSAGGDVCILVVPDPLAIGLLHPLLHCVD